MNTTKGAFGPAGYISKARPYKRYPDSRSPSTPSMREVYKGVPRRKDNTEKLKAARKLRKRLRRSA
jgi:hypothetical protein